MSAEYERRRPLFLRSIEWVGRDRCQVTFVDKDGERIVSECNFDEGSLVSMTPDPIHIADNWTAHQSRSVALAAVTFCQVAQDEFPE